MNGATRNRQLLTVGSDRKGSLVKRKDYLPEGKCAICGGEIAEIQVFSMAHGTDPNSGERVGMVTLTGACTHCDIDFYIYFTNGVSNDWVLKAPSASQLLEPLTQNEIAGLNAKLQRYQTLGKSWQVFLSRARDGDELWRYTHADGGITGITHVRCGVPIDQFETFGSL